MSYCKVILNDESEGIWKEAIVTVLRHFEYISKFHIGKTSDSGNYAQK